MLEGRGSTSKFRTNQHHPFKSAFFQEINHLLVFLVTSFSEFLHVTQNCYLVRRLHLTEVFQRRHHTGGIGIVCIHNQGIGSGMYQLRAIVLRHIRRQCVTDFCILHSEITTNGYSRQGIVQVIGPYQMRLYIMGDSFGCPAEMQERRTSYHFSRHIQSRSLSVTDAGQAGSNLVQIRILVLDEDGSISLFPQEIIQFSFGANDSFERAESLKMGLPHIGNDPVVRLGNVNQGLDFSRMISPHFDDRHLMLRLQAQQCQRHSDMVVEVSLRVKHLKLLAQHGCNQFFRGGFSVRTGHPNHAGTQPTAVIVGQLL